MHKFKSWPFFEDDEIRAVVKVLNSGKVNQWTGIEISSFEKEFADYMGLDHAVALANGSVALDTALSVLGICRGDEVIVTPRTFVASASCIVLRGATPVFVDVDRDTQNITAEAVHNAITSKTKAVIAVHLAGWPCELDTLRKICDENGLFLIEDCAQAHGARYRDRKVGTYGDVAVFSFCQDKIMTTGGEGGMLVTNKKELWKSVWGLKDHGKDYELVYNNEHPPGFRWLVNTFGTNYRMTEMQAAIGRIQLKKLDFWVKKRRTLATVLSNGFDQNVALRVTCPPDDVYHSYYKYYAFVRPEKLKQAWSRDRILYELSENGIPCGTGICPEVYLEKAFGNYEWKTGSGEKKRLEAAKKLGETSMMFLVHPTLEESDIAFVIEQMSNILRKAAI